MYFVMYPVICVLPVFGILTTILLLQNLYPSLALGCSFSFRLFCCWILCTDGMRTGSPRMSSSGWLLAVAISYTCLGSHWCFFVLFMLFCRCRYMALLVVSVVCYIATFCFSGLLFHWFTPSGHDCGLNLFFIVFTLILVFGFAIVALHPKVPSCSLFFSVLLILPLFILLDLTRNRCLISYTGWVWGLGQYYTCNSRLLGWFDCVLDSILAIVWPCFPKTMSIHFPWM